jgi:selenide,water dikinase
LERWELILLSDPTTSGGLLFTVPKERERYVLALAKELKVSLWYIGWVEEGEGLEVIKT